MAELRAILSSGDIDDISLNDINLRPQTPSPARVEGRVFYSADKKAVSSFSDVDMELNHGAEQIVRVFNNSGSTILNAVPVYNNGTSTSLPAIEPADALTLSQSLVVGITTHDVTTGAEAFVTSGGELGGDFTAFSIGDLLYVAEGGGMTTMAPEIATRLGVVLSNTVGGKMLVNIENHISLPTLIGYLKGGAVPATITGTDQTINNFTSSGSVAMAVDQALGQITVPSSGIYRVNINLSILHDSTGNNRPQVSLNVYNVTDSIDGFIVVGLGRDATGTLIGLSVVFPAIANKVYELRIKSDSDLTTVTGNLIDWDMESIQVTA